MLDKLLIEKVLDKALSQGANFAELYIEENYASNLKYFDQHTQSVISGKDFGAGLRVFYGEIAIYAYTNDLSETGLFKVAEAVSKAFHAHNTTIRIDLTVKKHGSIHPFLINHHDVAKAEKIEFIRKIDNASRNYSNKIKQVDIGMLERQQKILIANSEGLFTTDQRFYSRVMVNSIASDGTENQTGNENPGTLAGYEFFKSLDPVQLGESTAKTALVMLDADYVTGGKYPVVIDNGFGGVIFHEACGHALETTSVAKGASVFCGKLGQPIASEHVTAIDDGTMPNKWGSTNIDDEGNPTQNTTLIEKGILKSYMIDKLGGQKIGMESTGSGRRQSYKYAPTSRMRNTYIANGPHKLADLISSVDYGIYAKKMGGGSVMPGTGNFNFSVGEGYLIEKGKITKAIRGATLIGNGADALFKISMVADNLAFAEGMCGSASGSIPTCVGQPAIKIDEIVVGGR